MTEAYTFSHQHIENPQVMLWVDLIRTNSQTFRGIAPAPESVGRAKEFSIRAISIVMMFGGFETYWERFSESDLMARAYVDLYHEDAYRRAFTQYVLQTQIE